MGSYYSVHNDTGDDLWVWDGVNVDAIVWPSVGLLSLITAGAGTAAFGAAGAGAAGATAVTGAAASTAAASGSQLTAALATIAGAAGAGIVNGVTGLVVGQLSAVAIISAASAGTIAASLKISEAEAEKLKKQITYFKENCNRKLRRGDSHSSGKLSLSLVRTVWFMNDRTGEIVSRACWTGATDNSTNR